MHIHFFRIAISVCLLTDSLVWIACGADEPRKYADGPITPADFRAAVPDSVPVKDGVRLRAMTHTEIRYTTKYRWDEPTSGNVTAWLTRFDCYAALLREKCWDKEPADLRLLDHEQGHFDITEINARQAQQTYDRLIAGRELIGHGNDERSAVADLNKQIRDQMQKAFDIERDEQIEYDRVTNHGRDFVAQAKQRSLQRDRLKESASKDSDAKSK